MTTLSNSQSNSPSNSLHSSASNPTVWLRRVIQIDAGLFVLLGLLLLLDAAPLAQFLGIANGGILVACGLVALLYDGGRLVWASVGETLDRRVARLSAMVNTLWAIGSTAILLLNLFELSGTLWWTLAALTDLAALFAVLQWLGLRRSAR